MKCSIPKGTRDFLPIEMARRNYIFDTIRNVFKSYGFEPIETPSIENLSTLMGKYGEEGDKLLFKVLNSGDFMKDVDFNQDYHKVAPAICERGLRYDLTVPFARFVVQHRDQITFPFRPMSIATATAHHLVDLALERLDIQDYFTYVTTCGDLHTSKREPFIFDECARQIGTAKEETVVFEDSLHSIVTAHDAGYPVIGVYDDSAKSEEQQIRPLSTQYLKNWKEFHLD